MYIDQVVVAAWFVRCIMESVYSIASLAKVWSSLRWPVACTVTCLSSFNYLAGETKWKNVSVTSSNLQEPVSLFYIQLHTPLMTYEWNTRIITPGECGIWKWLVLYLHSLVQVYTHAHVWKPSWILFLSFAFRETRIPAGHITSCSLHPCLSLQTTY